MENTMHDYFKRENDYQASEVKRMKAAFESGALSRRNFLQGMLATGLALTSATAILAGSRDVRAATPKRGGRVRVAWDQHGPADTLDPALFTATIDYSRGRMHCNNLVQFQDDMSLGPDLAESWEVNSDATEFTFQLRKGVTFHDGKDCNADDVVYSMNRHLGEASTSKASSLVSMIKEWKKLDAHTVQAVLDSPNADLLAILGTFHFKVLQDGAEEKEGYFSKVIGTPVPSLARSSPPECEASPGATPNYFREGRPYVDEIEIFGITDNGGTCQRPHLGRRAPHGQPRSEGDQAGRGGGRSGIGFSGVRRHHPRSWRCSTAIPATTPTSCSRSSTCAGVSAWCARSSRGRA